LSEPYYDKIRRKFLIKGINRRIGLCLGYCDRGRDFNCSFADLLSKLFRRSCTILARYQILKIIDDGAYKLVYLRSIKYPLYWPNNMPLRSLYMVITESLYKDDWHYYEAPETTVEPGDIVLDCGAAEGLFSLKIMDRAECITIEPSPAFIGCLKKTFVGNGNVRIVPCALGSQAGQACLTSGILDSIVTGAKQNSPEGAVKVNVATIDRLVCDLGLTRVDYIKGDLESFELEVLKGAERTIREHMPKIAMTTYHPGNDWKEMRDYVLSLAPGYSWRVKGLSWSNEGPKPVMIHFWRPGRH